MDSAAWPDPAREWPSCLALCLLFFPFPFCFSQKLTFFHQFFSLHHPFFSSSFSLLLFSPSSPFSCSFFLSLSNSVPSHSSVFLLSLFTVAYLLILLNKADCPMLYPLWCAKDHASPVQSEQPAERTRLAQACFHTELE